MSVDEEDLKTSLDKAAKPFLAPLALRTTQFLGQALMGLLVMILGVYYFFADGPAMVQTLLRLSPLETSRTRELIDQFDSVTRAVVVATLLSAFVQGLLIGSRLLRGGRRLGVSVDRPGDAANPGAICGLGDRVGAGLPVAIRRRGPHDGGRGAGDLLFGDRRDHRQRGQAAGVARPLESASAAGVAERLGGVQALGPIGILVGPMVVAFLQTLLNMVHSELNNMTKPPVERGRKQTGDLVDVKKYMPLSFAV